MKQTNWKLIGMGLTALTGVLALVTNAVASKQQEEEIREAVAEEFDRRQKELES